MTPEATLAPVSPDRAELAVESARQPGGSLDPSSWIVPRGEALNTYLNTEPDQTRIAQDAYDWMQAGIGMKAKGQGGGVHEEFKTGLRQVVDHWKARGEEPFQHPPNPNLDRAHHSRARAAGFLRFCEVLNDGRYQEHLRRGWNRCPEISGHLR